MVALTRKVGKVVRIEIWRCIRNNILLVDLAVESNSGPVRDVSSLRKEKLWQRPYVPH